MYVTGDFPKLLSLFFSFKAHQINLNVAQIPRNSIQPAVFFKSNNEVTEMSHKPVLCNACSYLQSISLSVPLDA